MRDGRCDLELYWYCFSLYRRCCT